MRSFRRSRAGQIIIPALFLFPTLMLFVYLIYETAKLSREKIRHQFAVDAAVFVEMTNYSDFLNRTAYVNGAFPMRILDEGFKTTMIDCDQKANCHGPRSLWEIMCRRGDFPMKGNCNPGVPQDFQTEKSWNIEFGGDGYGKNSAPPQDATDWDMLTILTMDDANSFWINWDDANQVYKLYVQIYQLLGSVEDAQYSVLNRLAAQHNFLKKSYWLNTGTDINEAATAANLFDSAIGPLSSQVQYKCYRKLNFYGNKPTGSMFQPWQVYAPDRPPAMPQTIANCDGLFHLMWVNPSLTTKLRAPLGTSNYGSLGLPVNQLWSAPKNYFNHDFNQDFPQAKPAVHVTVAVGGFSRAKASVWPDPTPKFQVRSFP